MSGLDRASPLIMPRGCARPAPPRCAPRRRPRTRPARPAASGRSRAARRGRPRPTSTDVSGTPITGSDVCAATTPGSAAERPGAGDDHAQAAQLGVPRVVRDQVGIAMGGHDAHLVADAALAELLRGRLHRGHVALGAHHDADARGVDLHALELLARDPPRRAPRAPPRRAARGRAPRSCRDVPAQLGSGEADHVGGSIRGGTGCVAVLAERGHAEHAAARRDDLPVALGGARRGTPPCPRARRRARRSRLPTTSSPGIRATPAPRRPRHAGPTRARRRPGRRARSPRAAARAGRSAGAAARPASRDRRSAR